MAIEQNGSVKSAPAAPKLLDCVRSIHEIAPDQLPGCTVFVHYNGPTDQLSAVSMGMAVLDPGGSPHEAHRHPEEEFLLVASGTGEIACGDSSTHVGPGSVMYCAGNTLHGIINTGVVPLTFYWSKWMAKAV